MSDATARYAFEQGTWFLHLGGDLRHTLGPALDALLDRALADPQSERFVIDLSAAVNIDSTCLGILARIGTHAAVNGGRRPTIVIASDEIRELLLAICFDRLFNLVAAAVTADGELEPLPGVAIDDPAQLALVLEAHRRLSAIDVANAAKFRDLLALLEHDAGRRRRGDD